MPRPLVKVALQEALLKCSGFSKKSQKQLIELAMLCLEKFIIEFKESFYTKKKRIVYR